MQPPALGGGRAFLATGDPWYGEYGSIHVFNWSNGSLLWRKIYSTSVNYAPILSGDLVYVSSADGHIRAYYQENGTLAWSMEAPNQIWAGTMVIAHEKLYFISTDGGNEVIRCYGIGPNVIVESIEPDITEAYPGDPVTINATVRNIGNVNATGEILDFFVDGELSPSWSVVLNVSVQGINTTAFVWDTAGYAPGNHTVKAMVRSNENYMTTDNITILEPPAPHLYIYDFFPMDIQPEPGDQVELRAVLKNNGTMDATDVTVQFFQGSVLIGSKTDDVPKGDIGVIFSTIWDTTGLPAGGYTLMAIESNSTYMEYEIELITQEIHIEVVSVVADPSEAYAGDEVTLKGKIENQGEGNLTSVVASIFFDKTELSSHVMSIKAGETNGTERDYEIELDTPPGNYTIWIRAGISHGNWLSSNSTTLRVLEKPAASKFDIKIEVEKTVLKVGEKTTVNVSVLYNGSVPANNLTLVLRDESIPKIADYFLGTMFKGQMLMTQFEYEGMVPGVHYLTAFIPNTSGESNQVPVTVEDDGGPSEKFTVKITDPSTGSEVKGRILVVAQVETPFGFVISKVELHLDGVWIGNMSPRHVAGEYSFYLNTSEHTEGDHVIQAMAVTTDDMNAKSDEVKLTFDNIGGVEPPPEIPKREVVAEENTWLWIVVVLIIVGICCIAGYRAAKRR